MLPIGDKDIVSTGDTPAGITLPVGFHAVSLDITDLEHNTYKRNIAITLSLVNVFLLEGGETRCDDTMGNAVMAACSIAGELTNSTYMPL